jgi:L-ribulose-5-phosphate 3-epimerase
MRNGSNGIPRREALRRATLAGLGTALAPAWPSLLEAAPGHPRFRIGACDWSLGKRQDPSALALARRIGLDGVQVSFDDVGAKYDLRKPEAREAYAAASKEQGVAISSLAMGILNSVPYASDPRAEQWVEDCVEVMAKMGQRVVLLAFFGKGDIKNRPELQDEVIRRLKKVAPRAEKAGVVLGVESWLNADEHRRILDAVASPSVQVYYDVANANKMGYDIYEEIRRLGKDRICQFHCKENGFLLGNGRIDFRKLRGVLDDIGYRGWLIIEGAVGQGLSLVDSYVHNQKFLRTVFAASL